MLRLNISAIQRFGDIKDIRLVLSDSSLVSVARMKITIEKRAN